MIEMLSITRSRLRQKILNYFFANTDKSLYVRETAGLLKEDPTNVSRELSRMEKEGIFTSERRGNQKYFRVNKGSGLYKELKSLIFKTIGVEGRLKKIVQEVAGIEKAFIYGSFAAGKEKGSSDIDLMVIGEPDPDVFMAKVEAAEKDLGREINYNIYPAKEFTEKLKKKDSFIKNLLSRSKIMLKGDADGV